MVILRLRRIGLGTWQSDGISKRLNTGQPGLELWRTKITKGGRIIWQVGNSASDHRLSVCLHECSGRSVHSLEISDQANAPLADVQLL